jgi:cell wall-associated NlpC family hydrolase
MTMRETARFFALLFAVTTAGCASSTGAVPKPFPRPGEAVPDRTPPAQPVIAAPDAYSIAGTALSLRGAPYRDGGSDPSGFDCSGFVRYVFAQHGVQLPRTVTEQFRAGRRVDVNELQPGDLVFFTTIAPGVSHVGMVIGGDEFVHAPSSSGIVRVEHLGATYWSSRFVGARRVL